MYITFGTEAGKMPEYASVYLEAMRAVEDLNTDVLITVGRDADPGMLGAPPPHVRVERWVDQATVLGHTAAVIWRGGGGSVLGALAAGAPLVVVPLFSEDQHTNARRLAAVGAGLELRVVQTGVQILFAFLLTLSFMDRFATVDAFQRAAYVFTLVASATTIVLLVAPVAVHRLLFQRGRKRELVRVRHRFALFGLASLAVTVLAGMLLALDAVVGRGTATVVVLVMGGVVVTLWVAVPLRVRHGHREPM